MKIDRVDMFKDAPAFIHENARHLRKNMTAAEKYLWSRLKDKPFGLKFRRQHPLGLYIADFYCHAAKLVIEVDGSVHNDELAKLIDDQKNFDVGGMGLKMLRFSNNDVITHIEGVMSTIEASLK